MRVRPVLTAALLALPCAAAAQSPIGMIGSNQQVSGNLAAGASVYEDKPIHLWGFQCIAGQTFQMDVFSDWDNYAVVFDPAGTPVARDDDGGDVGLNARLAHTCSTSGLYRLGVTTYSTATPPGPYTLMIQSSGTVMAATPSLPSTAAAPMSGMMGPNQQVTGNLAQYAATWNERPYQAWGFPCQAGQSFQMDVTAEWDNYAIVFDPAGTIVARDDDGGGYPNARIEHTCAATGLYRLGVTTFSTGTQPGVYTLRVTSSGVGMAMGQPAATTQPMLGMMGLNQQVSGVLSATDPHWDDKPYQAWGLQCFPGQGFQMDILSEWDNYALVLDPAGNIVARDDDSGDENLNARLYYTCAVAGVHRLVVTTYSSATEPGAYTLQVRGR